MGKYMGALAALFLTAVGIGYFFGQKSLLPRPVVTADAGVDAGTPPVCLMMACQWKQSDAGINGSVDCPKGFSAKRLEVANVIGCACCEGGGK